MPESEILQRLDALIEKLERLEKKYPRKPSGAELKQEKCKTI